MTSEDPTPAGDDPVAGATDETPAQPPRPRRRRPSILTITGLLLIAIGLGSLGWMGYQYFGTNAPAQQAAKSEISGLQDQWNNGGGIDVPDPSASASSTPGATSTASKGPKYTQAQLDQAMAILTIPRFGADYKVPILVGTSDYALGRGVGWYENTQLPGQIGNFAIAGHRVGKGEPFLNLDKLRPGDAVIVETHRQGRRHLGARPGARQDERQADPGAHHAHHVPGPVPLARPLRRLRPPRRHQEEVVRRGGAARTYLR